MKEHKNNKYLVLEVKKELSSYDYKIIKLFQLNMKCSNNEIINNKYF